MIPKAPDVDARREFLSVATAYRRRKRLASFVILPMFLFTGFAAILLSRAYALAGGLSFVAMVTLADFFIPKLACPVCHAEADKKLGKFCPACGHATIRAGKGIWSWPRCSTCGKQLVHTKGNAYYPICYCTHCSAHLDDEGL